VSDFTSKADTNFAGQDVRQGPEGDATYCSVIALLEPFNEPVNAAEYPQIAYFIGIERKKNGVPYHQT